MARPRIHVTAPVPAEVAEALARDFEASDSPVGVEGIVSMLTTRVDGAYLDSAGPQLKVVANYAVGVNNVDLAAAAERHVVVANTPDVLTRATAELAVGLMLALLRRIAEGDRFVRRRVEWVFSLEFMLGESLDGKRLLVVGPGRIGRETARLAEAFGARLAFAGRDDDIDVVEHVGDVLGDRDFVHRASTFLGKGKGRAVATPRVAQVGASPALRLPGSRSDRRLIDTATCGRVRIPLA